jgi:branched-chain amino acid transport system permease protein
MDYLLHVATLLSIYILLAASLDLLVGHSGLMSLAHAGLFGAGAYASALSASHLQTSFGVAAGLAMAVSSLLSLLMCVPSWRLRDESFVIVTFAAQVSLSGIFNNWTDVTRGPLGLSGIPMPTVWGWTPESKLTLLVLIGSAAAAGYVLLLRLIDSPFGRVLHAIREDEVLATALGKRVFPAKAAVCALSAAFAGLAGSLYAHYMSYIDPGSFATGESILLISMVIIGGAGSRFGPFVGATVLVLLPEALRFVGLPPDVAASFRQAAYGVTLVLLTLLRPGGLMGRYAFEH